MVDTQQSTPSVLPSVERIQQELARAKSIDDFFGKEGIFARLFADTLEQMLEAELTAHLGYPRHPPKHAIRAIAGMASAAASCQRRVAILPSRCRATATVPFNRRCWTPIRPAPTNWRTRLSAPPPKACPHATFRTPCTRRMGSRSRRPPSA